MGPPRLFWAGAFFFVIRPRRKISSQGATLMHDTTTPPLFPPKKIGQLRRITIQIDSVKSDPITTPKLVVDPVAWGCVIKSDDQVVYEKTAITAAPVSSPVAKWNALHYALEFLVQHKILNDHVTVYLDHLHIINIMAKMQIVPDAYHPFWEPCAKLAAMFSNIKFVWGTRSDTRQARELAIKALESPRIEV